MFKQLKVSLCVIVTFLAAPLHGMNSTSTVKDEKRVVVYPSWHYMYLAPTKVRTHDGTEAPMSSPVLSTKTSTGSAQTTQTVPAVTTQPYSGQEQAPLYYWTSSGPVAVSQLLSSTGQSSTSQSSSSQSTTVTDKATTYMDVHDVSVAVPMYTTTSTGSLPTMATMMSTATNAKQCTGTMSSTSAATSTGKMEVCMVDPHCTFDDQFEIHGGVARPVRDETKPLDDDDDDDGELIHVYTITPRFDKNDAKHHRQPCCVKLDLKKS